MNIKHFFIPFLIATLLAGLVGSRVAQPAWADPGIIYVNQDAPGSTHDGASWGTAYLSLTDALIAAVSGDQIWVAEGVYKPTTDPADRTATFSLKSSVALYGGFAGTESSLGERDIDAHPTVLSGDIDNNDSQTPVITDITTVTGNTTNSYHVVTGNEVYGDPTLDGFTITGGYANSGDWPTGGGIKFNDKFNNGAHLILSNMTINGNYSGYRGGGMGTWTAYTTMNNVTFNSNYADLAGGGFCQVEALGPSNFTDVLFTGNIALRGAGMYDYNGANAVYTRVEFTDNFTQSDGTTPTLGGGLFVQNTAPTLNHTTFSGNQANWGGGLALLESTGAVINDSVFNGNTATGFGTVSGWGGGILIDHANPSLNRVSVRGNTANTTGSRAQGGGIGIQNSSGIGASFTNVLISGNKSIDGAGFSVTGETTNVVFTNVTVTGNYSYGGQLSGGRVDFDSSIQMRNSIVYGNKAYDGSDDDQLNFTLGSSGIIDNSILANGCPSGATCSNISTSDPQFVTPIDATGAPTTTGNLRLDFGSPAIDTGMTTGCPTTDLDGLPRPNDGDADGTATCDMGAYEAGEMVCGVSEGSTYSFPDQSGISIEIATLGPNLSCLYVDEMEISHTNATSDLQTGRYWLIRGLQSDKITDASDFDVTLTLPFAAADIATRACRWLEGTGDWDCGDDSHTTFVANTWVIRSNVTGFSDWVVGDLPLLRLYAAPGGLTSGACDIWANACELQYALSTPTIGQEIWAQAGTYHPGASGDRAATFQLQNGVALYGGFAGVESNRDARNWIANPSILSGDLNENGRDTNDAYHVVTGSNTDAATVLDGFTISGGYANDYDSNSFGAGMYILNGAPTLRHIVFTGNATHNTNTYAGGGLYLENGSPALSDLTFSNNYAYNGGGMYSKNSSPSMTRSTFRANQAYAGGGLYNASASTPTLTNIIFTGNQATAGAGVYNSASAPNLYNVSFAGNTATTGAGLRNQTGSRPVLENVVIWGNSGAAIADASTSNYAIVSNSIIQGGYSGANNVDPLFVDANGPDDTYGSADDDLRLNFGSPAIEAGTNTNCPSDDLDGLPRPNDGNADGIATCDMGAYEAGEMVCATPYTFANQSSFSIEIATSGNLTCLYVDEMETSHANATTSLQTGRYWLIRGLQSDKLTDASGFDVTLTLPFAAADATTRACRWLEGTGGGSGWDCDDGSHTTFVANAWVIRSNVTGFSDWAVGEHVGPTAVHLSSFRAYAPAYMNLVFLGSLMGLLVGLILVGRRKPRTKK